MTRDAAVTADAAFAFLADLGTLSQWTPTRWEPAPDGSATGISGVDGRRLQVAHQVDAARRTVWFTVTDVDGGGPSQPLLGVRVVEGIEVGIVGCRITLFAWRPARFDDARWAAVHAAHVAEVDVLITVLEGR